MRFPYAPLEHSLPVAHSMIISSGTFTTLPIYIHRDEHQAIAGSDTLEKDWLKAFGKRPSSLGCRSSYGHLAALSLPEAIPGRLPVCAYIMDYMLYHDDEADLNVAHAKEAHSKLGIDLQSASSQQQHQSQGGGKAFIRSTMVTKLLELDPRGAARLLEQWKSYTVVCAQAVHSKFNTFSQYADHRYHEAAIPLYFEIMAFATGLSLADHENAQVAHILRPLGMAMALVNDYYSFDKENKLSGQSEYSSSDVLYNGVAYLMRESSLSVEAAKEALKDMILELEREFCRLRDDWINSGEGVSDCLKKYICYAQLTAGGSAYWHARAPRYQTSSETRAQDHDGLLSPSTDATATDDSGSTDYLSQSNWPDRVSRLGSVSSYGIPALTAIRPVMEPYNYISSLPQKGLREKLALALNIWFQVPQQQLNAINKIISTLHSASLMLDDVQDRSPLRRGRPSAHMVFGEPQTINTASYLIVEAMRQTCQNLNTDAIHIFIEHVTALHEGQGLDIEWRESLSVPSETEYLEMVDMKTGAMFQLLWRLMQGEAASTRHLDLTHLIKVMGRFFQVRDDYLNLVSTQYRQLKGFCEDLDEGKMSLVMIYTLEVSTLARKIMEMRSRSRKNCMMDEMKSLMLEEIKRNKALEKTEAMLHSLHTELLEAIGALEVDTGIENEIVRMIVEKLKA